MAECKVSRVRTIISFANTILSIPYSGHQNIFIENKDATYANYKVFLFWVCWKQSNYYHSHIPPINKELPYLEILINLILNTFFLFEWDIYKHVDHYLIQSSNKTRSMWNNNIEDYHSDAWCCGFNEQGWGLAWYWLDCVLFLFYYYFI